MPSLTSFLTEIIEPLAPEFGGNIFKRAGELVLIEFDSVVEAARCAAAMRDAASQMNQRLPNEQRIAMRIGINLGDVIAEGGDVFGDGVNIAARIEALAEPGSIYVSGIVHDQVVDRIDFDFEDLGPKELKNIRRPIHVYRMGGETADELEALEAAEPIAPERPPSFDDHRAIAVLPFNNFSGDPEQEFFADGITEDIISLLAGWRAFPVIARNSTFTYKGQTVDVKKVGQELGARYIVEGSVRKSGHRVRVTAQLIQTDTGHHIMAERYDRDLTDLFELQDEIAARSPARSSRNSLNLSATASPSARNITRTPTSSTSTACGIITGKTSRTTSRRKTYFRRALAIDPQYPQATAALSIALTSAAMLGWADNAERRFEEAYVLAQQAVTLDPRYPNAHFALGLVCMWTRRSERAIAAFEEAIKLNPSFAAAHVLLGQMYLYRGSSPRKRSRQPKRGSASAPATRVCSFGCRRWPGHIISCGIIRRRSKPGAAPGRSTATGRTACAMSLPVWPSSRKLPRHRQLLPSSN